MRNGGRVCLSQQPAPTDKRGDVAEIGPEGREYLGDGGLDVIEGSEELIADLVLELIKEAFDGIEFRAVGWKLEEVDALGDFVSTDLGMPASAALRHQSSKRAAIFSMERRFQSWRSSSLR